MSAKRMPSSTPPPAGEGVDHDWFYVQFNYGGWTECECGFIPSSQEDMDAHVKKGPELMRVAGAP